jgi:hypothetical protein
MGNKFTAIFTPRLLLLLPFQGFQQGGEVGQRPSPLQNLPPAQSRVLPHLAWVSSPKAQKIFRVADS